MICWGSMQFDSSTISAQSIAAGGVHDLALKADGSIIGWGHNYWGQATAPPGNDYVAVAAGAGHSLALKADGSLVAWGFNDCGQATPPEGNNYVAIAAGNKQSLVLQSINSLPVVDEIVVSAEVVLLGTSIDAIGSFVDADSDDVHQAVWDWGDATTSDGSIDEANGTGTVIGDHLYTEVGVYPVSLIVTDNHDGAGVGVFEYVEVTTPILLVEDLIEVVLDMNLQNGIENGLDAKLNAALNALDDANENNDVAAVNSLEAFTNAVEAQRGNKISVDDADTLTAEAQQMIDVLEGQ